MLKNHGVLAKSNGIFDTKGRNRLSGKPLNTRDSGTLGFAGIPCLALGLHQAAWERRLQAAAVIANLTPLKKD